MEELAIRVSNVSKMYKLYDKASDRLKESLGLTRQKRYKEHYALKNVNFEVKRGETVGIIGTNGSGKSTILKIITGVLNPTEGNVKVDGRISALLELGAGFNMEYTGIENVYLNGTMLGFSQAEIDERLDAILEFADIGDFVHQPVKSYSSGMFVRLAFAVAINIDPDILIVDEALSVGDVFFQAKCYRKFEEFKNQGKTILFVSHDLGSISKYCDRSILINKGVKLAEGTPKEMINMYKKLLVGQLSLDEEEEQEDAEINSVDLPEETPKQEVIQSNPELLEYGNKAAEILSYTIEDSNGIVTDTIEKGTDFVIRVKLKFHQRVPEPICAFSIKNVQGIEITGTNTMIENHHIGSREAGEEAEISFYQKMSLQGAEYLLSLGCTGYEQGEFQVYHRLYDVCNLTVISDKNTVGYYDMDTEVRIS
ncbi:MAG: ABC transporter ATP-binding protein [Lachnospiraceae bacterium]|nr:ABC transporter ATP-binding protein [Lachnospiraceae bacterium]